MYRGYIKLYRSSEENPMYFEEPFTAWSAWQDLLLLANHKENQINIRGNIVTIKRGEIGRSEETLAERWKWSRGKVRRYIERLKTIQQIVQQKSPVLSIISIINYDKYQQNGTTDGTTERQQTVQQTDTNNNVKECLSMIKNEEEVKNNSNTFVPKVTKFIKPDINSISQYFNEYSLQQQKSIDLVNTPQRFLDYYESNGWKVGKNPMKDWKATIRTWVNKDQQVHLGKSRVRGGSAAELYEWAKENVIGK